VWQDSKFANLFDEKAEIKPFFPPWTDRTKEALHKDQWS
jgi:hypothetical protein